jgi:hypothetical protein
LKGPEQLPNTAIGGLYLAGFFPMPAPVVSRERSGLVPLRLIKFLQDRTAAVEPAT